VKARGVKDIDLWVTDGGQAMLGAIRLTFAASQRQRCVMHKLENVLSSVPQKQREQVEPELKAVLYQHTRQEADQAVAAFVGSAYPILLSVREAMWTLSLMYSGSFTSALMRKMVKLGKSIRLCYPFS